MFFSHYRIISLWKRVGAFIWTTLNPLHPRMLCAKFGWNCPSGLGEEDENVKNLRQWWHKRTNFDQKSSLEPSTQVSLKWNFHFRAQWNTVYMSQNTSWTTLKQNHIPKLAEACKGWNLSIPGLSCSSWKQANLYVSTQRS